MSASESYLQQVEIIVLKKIYILADLYKKDIFS